MIANIWTKLLSSKSASDSDRDTSNDSRTEAVMDDFADSLDPINKAETIVDRNQNEPTVEITDHLLADASTRQENQQPGEPEHDFFDDLGWDDES